MNISKKSLFLSLLIAFLAGSGFSTWAGWGIQQDLANSKKALGAYVTEFGHLPQGLIDDRFLLVREKSGVEMSQPGHDVTSVGGQIITLSPEQTAQTIQGKQEENGENNDFRPVHEQK